MSRYRKIEVKTWMDEKFRSLSPMPPSGQGLWLFLMTGPHTGPIPGLFRAGRAGMAEELGWELEAFDEAFAEVLARGMVKADFKARLVWLPNALRHNKPESPNVVRSWRVERDLLPECDLKREALWQLREHLKTLGLSYVEAFDEVTQEGGGKPSKASGKSSPKPSPNQEQEQEQEQQQEQEGSAPIGAAGDAGKRVKTPAERRKSELWRAIKTLLVDSGECKDLKAAGAIVTKTINRYDEATALSAIEATLHKGPGGVIAYLEGACQQAVGLRQNKQEQLEAGNLAAAERFANEDDHATQ